MLKKRWLNPLLGLLVVLTLSIVGTINLESTPPLWWDEGWNLLSARNWIERGHYGPLLAGKPIPASIASSGFPVVGLAALSFRLFGIGIWQGRVVGILFTVGALVLMYYLALQLYGRSIAKSTLVVLLVMSGHRELHPLIMGRQAIGEIPAMFYLLGGYACFLSALRGSTWFIALATVFWSIALSTKLQVFPFWTVSLLTALSMALFRRNLKLVALLAFGLVGSLILSKLLLQVLQSLLGAQTLPPSQIRIHREVSFWVPFNLGPRLVALTLSLAFGLPSLLGVCYAASKLIRKGYEAALESPEQVVRLLLVVLVGSWLAWYLFLSVGWIRYLFPGTFIGSIFAAALLYHLTEGFNLSSTIERGCYTLRHLRFNQDHVGAFLAALLITWTFSVTILELYRSFVVDADESALRVADFINNQTPNNALIETYDSELFFLLNRRYHYPADHMDVQLNRRTFLGQDVPIEYDPLASNPDYLVIGPHSKLWRLYDPVLTTETFRLRHSYTRYDVYERVK
jgi:hypothetical protein